MLKTLALERYKAFVDRVEVELKPLTLLFGRNSAGKSSILRAIPLTAASIGPVKPNRMGPLALEHDAAMGMAYADLCSRLSTGSDLLISLTWDVEPPALVAGIEWHLRDIQDFSRRGQVVDQARLLDADGEILLETELDLDGDSDLQSGCHVLKDQPGSVAFEGLQLRSEGGLSKENETHVDDASRALKRISERVDWLSPLRDSIPRQTQPSENPAIQSDGWGTTELLSHPSRRALLARTTTWAKELFGHGVSVSHEAGDVALVADFDDGRPVNLCGVGSGVGQILPVLAHLALIAEGRADGRVIAIEQPEAHLHADAEVTLGRAIVEAVNARGQANAHGQAQERPSLVLETHSETLLLSLQLAVLEKRLAPEDLVAYWVYTDEDRKGRVEKITFDAQARPTPPWPSGVFSESTVLARKILQGRRGMRG